MQVIVIRDGGVSRVYDANFVAGYLGHDDTEVFQTMRVGSDLVESVRSIDPISEHVNVTQSALFRTLEAEGHEVLSTGVQLHEQQSLNAVDDSYKAGLAAVLLQAVRIDNIKLLLTRTATVVAAAAAVSLCAGTVSVAHAEDVGNSGNTGSRVTKDILGGSIGAILGHQIGKGRGRTLATILGGAAGVAVAEGLQNQRGSGPSLPSGSQPLPADRQAGLTSLERSFLSARNDYAKAIQADERGQEEVMLDRYNKVVGERWIGLHNAALASSAEYERQKNSFVSAAQYFGQHGYNVKDYSMSYSLALAPVSARDVARNDLARVSEREHAQTTRADRENLSLSSPE